MRLIALAMIVGGLGLPAVAHGQDEGNENSLSAGVSYVLGVSSKIVETEGAQIAPVDTLHHVLSLSAEYVTPLSGLSVEASLPIVGVKWDEGPIPHFPTEGEWDDGDLHFTATDLRAGLRYEILTEPLSVAASVAGSIPVSDYPTYGYTAPGRGLKMVHLGLALQRSLDPFLPRAYLGGSYEFTLAEKYDEVPETEEYGQSHSDFGATIGYFVLDSLDLHVAFEGLLYHDGIDFVDFNMLPEALQTHHDAVLKERQYLLGGGVAYQLSEIITVGAEARFFLAGANTRNANLFGVLVSFAIL